MHQDHASHHILSHGPFAVDTTIDAAVEEDRADTPIYHQPFTAPGRPGVQIPVFKLN